MRVAALCDVHGNVHALEAVLGEVQNEGVDAIVFGGDLASGPFPAETIELARSLGSAVFVRGNADVLASPALNAKADAARRWVGRQLDAERIEWLATLPFSYAVDDTLYVHANPVDVDEVVTELTPTARAAELLDGIDESRVVTGHVHIQFRRTIGGIEWIGAGSVGYPYEDEPGACWALAQDGDVAFRRTDYDRERAEAAIRASGHPRTAELLDSRPQRAEALRLLTT